MWGWLSGRAPHLALSIPLLPVRGQFSLSYSGWQDLHSYFTSPLFKGVHVSQLVYRYECDCMMSLGFVTHVFIFLVPSAICLKCRASPYTDTQLNCQVDMCSLTQSRTRQKCVLQWALIRAFLFDQLNTRSMHSCC